MSLQAPSPTPSSQKKTTTRHNLATITEQQFTNSILEYAQAYGWRRFHVRMSGVGGANVQGDRGFPDLVLLRENRLIFAELKVGRNKPSPEQEAWMAALLNLQVYEVGVYVWHPAQWPDILAVLQR